MNVAPVAEANRIQSLDVTRGLAVLGILAVNASYFAAPWQATMNPLLPPLAVDQSTLWSWFMMHVFFEFKFITLFSLLFGASLYLVGGERIDAERGAVLRRRLLWLLIFGIIHASLIWSGDILVTYALTGFLVLHARSWAPQTLMVVGTVLLAASIALQSVFGLMFHALSPGQLAEVEAQIWAPPAEELERVSEAYRGGLISATLENIALWTQYLVSALLGLMIRTAGVMMIGMALLKFGFLSGKAPRWLYWVALAIGATAIGAIAWQAWLNVQADFEFAHMQTRGAFVNTALSIFVSVGYASLMVVLVKTGAGRLLSPLAAVGRMAFTNYITQSLIMTTIFWGGRGLGLFGEVDRPTLWAIVLAIWALQLIWSPLWLKRFQMGPLEWAWRRLSYRAPVAMTRSIQGGST